MDAPSGIERQRLLHGEQRPLMLIPSHLSTCASVICPRGANSPPPALANSTSRSACLLLDHLVKSVKIGQLRDVPLHAHCGVSDLLDRLVEFLLPTAADEYLCPFAGESVRGRKAKATTATGDERHFVCKFLGHDVWFLVEDFGSLPFPRAND